MAADDDLTIDQLIEKYGLIEVKLAEYGDFLKVKETLTRIGIPQGENTLFQSCHVLHKRGRYFITHFKQLFALDQKPTNFSESDKARLNTIVHLLKEWKLLTVVDETKIADPKAPMSVIKVIPFREKSKWNLKAKYTIGKKKRRKDNIEDPPLDPELIPEDDDREWIDDIP